VHDEGPDPYVDGTAAWWHLSGPSPELLEALDAGWLRPGMRVLDLGCGLATDLAYLATRGFTAVGIDQSEAALSQARTVHRDIELIAGDVRDLPFEPASFDYLLDRGCFHYLPSAARPIYAREAARVLRRGGELLLRACLQAQGIRNDITQDSIREVFADWRVVMLEARLIPSDTRTMEALVVRLAKG
jgi:ubiquinone/menaquinone biosynthesis C-methylase UbiE